MKKNNLIYVLMSFLSFSLLFGSFYFIVTEEIMLGAILAVISLFSIGTVFFLLRRQTNKELQPVDHLSSEEIHYEKHPDDEEEMIEAQSPNAYGDVELVSYDDEDEFTKETSIIEDDETEPLEEEMIMKEAFETLEAQSVHNEPTEDFYEFDLIVNQNFDENMMTVVSDMVDQDMFLESFEFKYDVEEIQEHMLVGDNLYKYKFHPIPHTEFKPDPHNDRIIKVLIGLDPHKMIDIGYVPQRDIDKVQQILTSIKDIKAYLSGGTYNVVENNTSVLRTYTDPFIINLRLYQ